MSLSTCGFLGCNHLPIPPASHSELISKPRCFPPSAFTQRLHCFQPSPSVQTLTACLPLSPTAPTSRSQCLPLVALSGVRLACCHGPCRPISDLHQRPSAAAAKLPLSIPGCPAVAQAAVGTSLASCAWINPCVERIAPAGLSERLRPAGLSWNVTVVSLSVSPTVCAVPPASLQ